MAIDAKVFTVKDLPGEFDPAEEMQIVPAQPNVALRLINKHNRHLWFSQGLRPVKFGSNLVKNEELFDRTADNTLRVGDLEVWAELESHRQLRRIDEDKKAKEQLAKVDEMTRRQLEEAAAETKGLVSIVPRSKSQPGVEVTTSVERGRKPTRTAEAEDAGSGTGDPAKSVFDE